MSDWGRTADDNVHPPIGAPPRYEPAVFPGRAHRWIPEAKVWDCEQDMAEMRAALTALVDWAESADIELQNEGCGPDGGPVIAAAKAALAKVPG